MDASTSASGKSVAKVAKWRCMRSMMKKEPAVGFIAADVLHVADLLHRELLEVVEAAVVDLLAQQRDRRLRAVLVGRRHVDVVDEVDELLGARRAEHRARLLLERLLEHELQRAGVGERVEVDVEVHQLVGQGCRARGCRRRWSSSPCPRRRRASPACWREPGVVDQEREARRVHRRHDDRRERRPSPSREVRVRGMTSRQCTPSSPSPGRCSSRRRGRRRGT